MSDAVTIREHVGEALLSARPGGLTMAALGGVVAGPWRTRDVEGVVRGMWERNELARRGDGTFVLTEKAAAAKDLDGRARHKTGRHQRAIDAAVKRVGEQGRREGHDTTVRVRRVDPALLRAFCPKCRDTVSPRLDGTCASCGTQTGGAVAIEEPKRRRTRRRRPLKKGQAGYGPVCPKCGGPKSVQAHGCRSCVAGKGRKSTGRQRGPRPARRVPKCMTEELLQESRRMYASGKSLRQIAAEIFEQTTYKSVASCAEGLYSLYKTRGWPLRPQREVTAARNFKHGRKTRSVRGGPGEVAYRHWLAEQRGWNAVQGPGQPICKGVKKQAPGKGRPCEHHAQEGSEWCWSHDPARELERQAQAARMRSRLRRQPTLPAGPFVEWLRQLHRALGKWERVAEAIGVDKSMANRWGGPRAPERITVRVVERSAAAAGVTVQDIYGDVAAAAAA